MPCADGRWLPSSDSYPGRARFDTGVRDMADTTEIVTEDLRALFDIGVGSMNFTSGCLDTDEVEVLRRVAAALGVDPMAGTPSEFATQYPHDFKPHHYLQDEREFFRKQGRDKCGWCCRPEAEHPDNLRRR